MKALAEVLSAIAQHDMNELMLRRQMLQIQLGFPTTANFCRYFRRATGIYPQAYKQQQING